MPKLARPSLIAAAIATLLAAGTPALAQDGGTAPAAPALGAAPPVPPLSAPAPVLTPDAPAPGGLATGTPAEGGIGSPYVASTHGDWSLRCLRTAEGKDPCQLFQLLKDAQGNSVAEFSMVPLPAGQQAAARVTIITPLETLLTQQITLQTDSNPAKRYPFAWCAPVGCFALIGITEPEVEQMKRGSKATMNIVPVAAPDQKVNLTVSLRGFTAGYDAVTAANRP